MNGRKLCRAAGGAGATLVVLAACSGQTVVTGEMVVVIDADVSLPKDIDEVRIEVLSGGQGGPLLFGKSYGVPGATHLPATLGLVAGQHDTVDVRVLGSLGSTVKTLREAITTVPTDRQVTLRMPIEWLCYNQVTTASGGPESTCPSGQTCVAGQCASARVDSNTLATYEPAQVFGGAPAPGKSGSCFDTVACFGGGYVPLLDTAACTIPAPKGGVGINVGLVTSASGGVGICGADSCYIPLDYSLEGWSVKGDVISLPPAVCSRVNSGKVLSVVATSTCITKTPSIPTCGAWSSVTSMPGTVDAAAPDGAVGLPDAEVDVAADVSGDVPSDVTSGQTVGADGGTIQLADGTEVVVPPGALTSDVTVTIAPNASAPPLAQAVPVGSTYLVEPEGQQFLAPVTVTLAFQPASLPPGATANDVVEYTAPAGSNNYQPLPTKVADATHVTAQTTHFSNMVAGVPVAPPDAGDDGAPTDATAVDSTVADATTGEGGADAGVCIPATCQSLGYTCGAAGDGCGGVIASCGTCTGTVTCGGGGKPYVCGACTGALCSQIVACSDGGLTSVSGQVVAPSGVDPIPGAIVFVPSGALAPFPAGVQCTACGAPAGTAITTTTTGVDGTFTLANVPAGANIPVVIQLGRWRREFFFTVPACVTTAVGALKMPSTQAQGDIPLTAVSTGAGDSIECVLRKMGIADTEFTPSTGTGRVRLYASPADYVNPSGSGVTAPGGDAGVGESTLMTTDYANYDQIILPCWGAAVVKPAAELNNLTTYTNLGGKVLTNHYGYTWLYQNVNGGLNATANWNVNSNTTETTATGTIDTTTPATSTFSQWMNYVGALSLPSPPQAVLVKPRHDVDSVVAPSQTWISGPDPMSDAGLSQLLLFTFNTPVGAAPASQCGRVVYADFHVNNNTGAGPSAVFPTECDTNPMAPQERAFEYMIWNLAGGTCLTPPSPTCTPLTCATQPGGPVNCGPVGDGCGNLLSCGSCTAPETCGGGGYGKCG